MGAGGGDPLFGPEFDDWVALSTMAPQLPGASLTNPYRADYAPEQQDLLETCKAVVQRISLGISCLVLAVTATIIEIAAIAKATGYYANGGDPASATARAIDAAVLGGLLIGLIGAVLGAVSIAQKARDVVLAYLGVVGNVLIILFVAGLITINFIFG